MIAMKDSGIEWVGQIPAHWNCLPIYSAMNENTTKNSLGIEKTALKYTYGTIVRKPDFEADEDSYVASTILNYTVVSPGDIVLNGLNLNFDFVSQRIAIVRERGVITSAYMCMTPNRKKVVPEFVNYLFKSYDGCKALHNMGGGVRKILNYSEFKKYYMCYPSLAEQHRIVDYLDHKCAEIDALSDDVQKEIETLQEYRRSLITEVVTKGLDSNVEMKDSGIEWAGDIPSNWNTQRIKTLFRLREEKNYRPLDEVNLISLYTDLGVIQHSDLEKTTGNKAFTADGYKIVKENDIVVNIILCWMGAIGRSAFSGVTSPAYDVYIPFADIDARYYHYYFRTKGFSGDCYKRGKGIMAMRWRTYSDQFRDIRVVVPPLSEQNRIVVYLDRKCAEIDAIIETKQKQLEILSEYRKALIYEYVTGKKEVV